MKMNIKFEDFKSQLIYGNEIGRGAYGSVYKINVDKRDYAVKQINLKGLSEKEILSIKNQAKNVIDINHENVVKYYNSYEDKGSFFIIMEYCDNSDLYKFIENKKEKENNTLIDSYIIYLIVKDICLGLKEIHNNNTIHRDLKPENIFVSKDYSFKIGDFDFAKKLIGTQNAISIIGTPNYVAPEILKKEKYNKKVDIWSLGCIIYELCTLEQCFPNSLGINITQNILSCKYKKMENNNEWQKIVDKLLQINPDKRLDIDKIINLINNLDYKNYNLDEKYFNSLDKFSQNVIINNILKTSNHIEIIVKVQPKDISNKIYFLENDDYLRNNESCKFDYYNEEINNLNEKKIQLLINGQIKTKNIQKYFIPDKEGEYKIILIFKNKMKDCRYMFRNCDNITSVDLSSFDSSNVTNMKYMFGKCHFLKEVKLNNLVTDKVTDMSYMFFNCFYLDKLIFPPSFNTNNVTKMDLMFCGCQRITDIKFSSSFKTNNVTTMKSMFKECYQLKNIDLKYFTTEKLTVMGYMFEECTNLESISFNEEFKTYSVTNMVHLFYNCEKLKKINLLSFNTENVIFFNNMFDNCESLENLDISSFKIDKNKSQISNMFDNLKIIDKIKVNQNSIDYFKESFQNIRDKFYC